MYTILQLLYFSFIYENESNNLLYSKIGGTKYLYNQLICRDVKYITFRSFNISVSWFFRSSKDRLFASIKKERRKQYPNVKWKVTFTWSIGDSTLHYCRLCVALWYMLHNIELTYLTWNGGHIHRETLFLRGHARPHFIPQGKPTELYLCIIVSKFN